MALVPVTTFGLLWWLMVRYRGRSGLGMLSVRGAFVTTQVAFQALLVLITESLSIGHHLTPEAAVAAWLLSSGLLAFVLVRGSISRGSTWRISRSTVHRLRNSLAGHPAEIWIGVGMIVVVVAVLAGIGWAYQPTNTDSLIYHLTRVAHWVQDRTVAHFATHYLGQIELAPLHEFNMLHLHLLTGTDRFDGYPQLIAFVVCVVGASEMAKLLGASARTQVMAAVICAVVPSMILEATSTQNNLFAASIGVAALVLMLCWRPSGPWIGRSVLLGLAGGLALLSKGTLPALLVPAALLLATRAVAQQIRLVSPRAAALRSMSVVAIVALSAAAVAAPFLVRNIELFDSPVGPVSKSTRMDDLSLRAGAANVIRSTAVNFMIGNGENGPQTLVSRVGLGGLRRIYSHLGVAADDPRYVLGSQTDAFARADYGLVNRVEEYGANPWHVILLTLAGVVICFRAVRGDRSLRLAALLAVGLALGYVLFSATAKWSVYVPRYQEPLLAAWSPLIAIALATFPRLVSRIVLVLLFLACLPQLLNNEARSLLHFDHRTASDIDGYFPGFGAYQDGREGDYLSVRDAIVASKCQRVGIANLIAIEYPIWAGLDHAGWKGTIEHIDVTNVSRRLEDRDFRPCAVLREVGPDDAPDATGRRELRFGTLALALDRDLPVSTTGGP